MVTLRSMNQGRAVVLLLASSLTVLAGAIVAPSLPGLRAAFAHQAGVELLARLVLTAPALGVVLGAPLVGRLVDGLGRRKVLVAGLMIYGLGGTSGLWLPTLPTILVGRFVLGLGVAGVMTASTTLIADLTAGPQRGRFMGFQAAFMGLGGLAFLTLGGRLADVGWYWPFATYAAAWLLVPAVLFTLPPDGPRRTSASQTRSLPRAVLGLYAFAFGGMVLFYLAPVQLPFLLNQRLSAGGTGIGLVLGLMTVTSASSSFLFARLQRRLGFGGVLILTFACMAPGLALVSWASTWAGVLLGMAVFGVSVGILGPNLNLRITALVPDDQRGRALGNLITAIFLGQFLSPVIASPVLLAGGSLGLVFGLGAGLAGLIMMAAVVVGRRR
jgi:MFS family permease